MNIKSFGVRGDGISDDTAAFQSALAAGGRIEIPDGLYKISDTLAVRSDTHIEATNGARIFCADGSCDSPDSYLLAGNEIENVTIRGGIWDGNNAQNHRRGNLWDVTSNKGLLMRFVGAKNLVIENLTLTNAESYYLTLCRTYGFRIENIIFDADTLTPNQDGVHLAGCCEDGIIRNLRAAKAGPTNDDMVAFNADDCLTRLTNLGLCCGPIRRVTVENVEAENCHTMIRLLSVVSEISDVTIKNVRGGVRCNAFNVDAARYCAAPIFSDSDYPEGVGSLRNILIENVEVWKTTSSGSPLSVFETNSDGVIIKNYVRRRELEPENNAVGFSFRNMRKTSLTIDGEQTVIENHAAHTIDSDAITSLEIF